jgi:hypothetical protein
MTTTEQKEICTAYQKGEITDRTFNTLFCTYWNEFVKIHGYDKLQKASEKEAYTAFCHYVSKGEI